MSFARIPRSALNIGAAALFFIMAMASPAMAQLSCVGTAGSSNLSINYCGTPAANFGVYGNVSIGSSYFGATPPTNGLTVQGNVGIGTTNPPVNLVIGAPAPAQAFYASGGATDQKYWDSYVGGNTLAFRALNDGYSAANTWMQVNRGSGYTISNVVFPNGNVGIGTTSPNVALAVQGTPYYGTAKIIGSGINQESDIGFHASNISDGAVGDWLVGTNINNQVGTFSIYAAGLSQPLAFNILTNGNVGIGSTSPRSILDISASSSAVILPQGAVEPSAVTGMLRFNTGSSTFEGYDGTYWEDLGGLLDTFSAGTVTAPGLAVDSNTSTGLFQASTNTLSISAGGKEAFRFLQGSGTVANYLTATGASTGNGPTLATAGSDTNINLILSPKGTGNVGIGTTSPPNLLFVASNVNLTSAAPTQITAGIELGTVGGATLRLAADNTNNLTSIQGYTAPATPSNLLLEQSGGYVGIGTASPQAMLDVNGYAKLALNSSAPAACSTSTDGSIALTHTRNTCVCVGNLSAWTNMVLGNACIW